MKKGALPALLVLGSIIGVPSAEAALREHFGKSVSVLEAADSSCIFFQLTDVTEANPAVPSGVWFGIDKNQGSAKEMYALVLGARLSGTPLPAS